MKKYKQVTYNIVKALGYDNIQLLKLSTPLKNVFQNYFSTILL